MRRASWWMIAALSGCGAQARPGNPPGGAGQATSPSAGASAVAAVPGPVIAKIDPKLPAKAFTVAAPVSFKPMAGAPKKKLLHPSRTYASLAPDGTTTFTAYANESTLLSSANAKGVAIEVADVFTTSWSSDSKLFAITQARGPLTVLAAPSGKLVWSFDRGGACAAAFPSPSTLVFHGESSDGYDRTPRLWRVDLSSGNEKAKPTPLGVERLATRCWADSEGKRFLVWGDGFGKGSPVTLVDGATGGASVVIDDVGASYISGAPTADRLCYVDDDKRALFCAKVGATQLELLNPPGNGVGMEAIFDDTGKRAFFGNAQEDKNGPYILFYLADFEAGTVRALKGVALKSGGTLALLSGGHVVAGGSGAGVDLYDVDAGTHLFVPGSQYYSVRAVPGRPRSVFVGEEYSGSMEKLYQVELP